MFKTYRYRIYPTEKQKILLEKHFGTARLIYNLALECKINAYKSNHINISCYDLKKQLVDLKNEFVWLKEINSQSLQEVIFNLDFAYKNFYKQNNGFPKFKKKSAKNSFRVPQNISIENSKVFIPKFLKGIKIVVDRPVKGTIKSATVIKTKTNNFYINILCESENIVIKKPVISKTSIGIDLGLRNFIILSNGDKISNARFLKQNYKIIKHLHKELSRKINGSNKYEKTRLKLAKWYEKTTNQKNDFLHKLSNEIVNQYDTICIENLNIKGMLKNKNLSKFISDVSWSSFTLMLSYKSEWRGKNLIKIGRFEPSSKICNSCGYINRELKSQINWMCPKCNSKHDRDINAAKNIKNIALKKLLMEHQLMNMETGSMDGSLNRLKEYPVNEVLSMKRCSS